MGTEIIIDRSFEGNSASDGHTIFPNKTFLRRSRANARKKPEMHNCDNIAITSRKHKIGTHDFYSYSSSFNFNRCSFTFSFNRISPSD